MRLFHTFTLFYFLACFSLDAGESENPLEGSLRDPWGIFSGAKNSETQEPPIHGSLARGLSPMSPSVSPPTESTATVTFGPSFKAFKSQYNLQLDLSTFGETGHDSSAARYDRGVTEWAEFQLTQTVFPSGAIFYGDPAALVTNRSLPDAATPTTQWKLVPLFTLVCASLLLIWAYLRVRYRAKCTSDI
ncbi:MAG: hypothetical protein VXZ84_05520 [Planctomycetota bacterium]|nr:hypothetical protein [Planctomycetota bacterium]